MACIFYTKYNNHKLTDNLIFAPIVFCKSVFYKN